MIIIDNIEYTDDQFSITPISKNKFFVMFDKYYKVGQNITKYCEIKRNKDYTFSVICTMQLADGDYDFKSALIAYDFSRGETKNKKQENLFKARELIFNRYFDEQKIISVNDFDKEGNSIILEKENVKYISLEKRKLIYSMIARRYEECYHILEGQQLLF